MNNNYNQNVARSDTLPPISGDYLLASIVESSEDAILSMNMDGIVISWNTRAEKMFGYNSQEIIGKSIQLIYPTNKISELEAILPKLKRYEHIEHYETERKHKNGNMLYVSLSVSPIKNKNNDLVGFAKIIRDISGQKNASAYARSLIEASLDPLVTISPEGKITDVNEATVNVTGVSRENLIDTDFSNYFTDPIKAREGYERVFKEGSVTDYPLSIKHLSGQIIDVLYNASVYKDDKGNVLGIFAAARDITETKKVEKQQAEFTYAKEKQQAEFTYAKEKQQLEFTDATAKQQLEFTDAKELQEKLKGVAKDEFSAMVTHELKTPLVPIIGYCKMFKTLMLGNINKDQADAIEVIEKNAKRLETLITDIMDVRKLDLDKMKFEIINLDLDKFFFDLDLDYKKILAKKKCQFIVNLYAKNIVIQSDNSRLRQCFANLIGNSIKFMPDNRGRIEIGCMKENNHIVFYVRDNGIGIPFEKQKELFQKFYQIDTSERRSIGGTGLGLAISKGIVEKLGGAISMESDGKTGTTFYMKFPL